jgi:hypothetical protein
MGIDPPAGKRKALIFVLIEFAWSSSFCQIMTVQYPERMIDRRADDPDFGMYRIERALIDIFMEFLNLSVRPFPKG